MDGIEDFPSFHSIFMMSDMVWWFTLHVHMDDSVPPVPPVPP